MTETPLSFSYSLLRILNSGTVTAATKVTQLSEEAGNAVVNDEIVRSSQSCRSRMPPATALGGEWNRCRQFAMPLVKRVAVSLVIKASRRA